MLEQGLSDPQLVWTPDGGMTRSSFMREAGLISKNLPTSGHVLNICSNRHEFALGLVAAWMAGVPTLLPSDQGRGQLAELERTYMPLHQINEEILESYRQDQPDQSQPYHNLFARLEQTAVIPFTSGTTGHPFPYPKSLASLMGSASLINEQVGGAEGIRMVATVPPQHMYGLELTVLLPFFEGAILDWRRPFFPSDVIAVLRDGPSPVALVTTPLHLRALLSLPDTSFPKVSFIVSATAPLALELAKEAEQRFSAPVHEVYGCTELGSIAGRRPTVSEVWHWYAGVRCSFVSDRYQVFASHVPEPATISDQLEILTDSSFLLKGRHADLVNIAGKRASIRALERLALQIWGVRDIAFVQDDEVGERVPRLAAIVVLEEGVSLSSVKASLRRELDPAFVPRVVVQVASLPRNDVGKLPRGSLLRLLR